MATEANTEATQSSGLDSVFNEIDAEEGQATDVEASEQDPGTETSDADTEVAADSGEEAAQEQGTPEGEGEEASIELPTQQMKQYPDALMEEYAKRFATTLEDVKGNRSLYFAVKKAIDTDIYNAQLKAQLDSLSSTEEDEGEQPEQEAQPLSEQQFFEQREQQLTQFVQRTVHPQAMQRFGQQLGQTLLRGLGVDPASAKTKEAKALVEGINKVAPELGNILAKGAADLVQTMLPQFIGQAVDARFPGFSERHETQLHRDAYESVVKSDQRFANMPKFDPRKGSEFVRVLSEAKKQVPGFDKMTFPGMSAADAASARYSILLKVASGQKLTSTETKAVYEAGQKDAKKATMARQNGKLVAGQSKGQPTQPTNRGNDDLFGAVGEASHRTILG